MKNCRRICKNAVTFIFSQNTPTVGVPSLNNWGSWMKVKLIYAALLISVTNKFINVISLSFFYKVSSLQNAISLAFESHAYRDQDIFVRQNVGIQCELLLNILTTAYSASIFHNQLAYKPSMPLLKKNTFKILDERDGLIAKISCSIMEFARKSTNASLKLMVTRMWVFDLLVIWPWAPFALDKTEVWQLFSKLEISL